MYYELRTKQFSKIKGQKRINLKFEEEFQTPVLVDIDNLQITMEEYDQIIDLEVVPTGNTAKRYFFTCPTCNERRMTVLFDGETVSCKYCIKLQFMIEQLEREKIIEPGQSNKRGDGS